MPLKNDNNALGNFLRDRRLRIDPASLGFPVVRRRTQGLRREEVAQLANVSPAWYTWLEQGRGGSPSTDVLDGLARALRLSDAEREHLYLLAQNRPPELVPREAEVVSPTLQHILDSFEFSPAMVRNSAWDILATNRAARIIWDTGDGGPEQHNVLESFFAEDAQRGPSTNVTCDSMARILVAQFRAEAFQAGFGPRAQKVVEGLLQRSAEFERQWNNLDVGTHFQSIKTIVLPRWGAISFEPASFSVDEQPGLKMIVFTPATPEDYALIKQSLQEATIK